MVNFRNFIQSLLLLIFTSHLQLVHCRGSQFVSCGSVTKLYNTHFKVPPEPVACGQKIRLEHLPTKKNLHSHLFSSPLSDEQEISAFGEDGEGDTGDYWSVICDGEYWDRQDSIMLRHVDTDKYLSVTTQQYGRPISGQSEIVGAHRAGVQGKWQAMEGIFIEPTSIPLHQRSFHDGSEL
ncbi:Stromal cell-derived factor 2-like protein 1 [Armadillidium nasatum]|uniref:Stromal cell-derived factor 2-like protein 1 n=1 Tax=Armadillidium nasatum TaxID=96803 RepID=A0A5N5SP58_9CRUS|nr:Stromal cell-derived factor 2-like protein 1 [Armadillidium nasatum]